mmetsp:Transcript_53749/g.64736  ORF Transcript_53749/g.64736 Transcript_53749/m.64736 type:complete len:251 (-) Transcript_53749:2639-3391(-)
MKFNDASLQKALSSDDDSEVNNPKLHSLKVEKDRDFPFAAIDFTPIWKKNLDLFMDGTRENIMSDTTAWIQKGKDQNFWMTGDAGTGKTVIAAKVIEQNLTDNNLVAWHFCSHNNPTQNTANEIIKSTSAMLVSNLPGYKEALYEEDAAINDKIMREKDATKLFDLLFQQPLKKMDAPIDKTGSFVRKMIVFEAIDEIRDPNLSIFLDLIRDAQLPLWFGLFITSRRYDDILTALSSKVSYDFALRVSND